MAPCNIEKRAVSATDSSYNLVDAGPYGELGLTARRRAVLRLLANEGRHTPRLRLFKLAFLLSRDLEAGTRQAGYEFCPYKYGPYSFTLDHDLSALARQGWVALTEDGVRLPPRLPDAASRPAPWLARRVDALSARYRERSTSGILRDVYRDHPWFTVNSADSARRAVRRPVGELAIYTVGYQGLLVDGLLDLLLRRGIRVLADVRRNAVSRRYGFHRGTLRDLCAKLGIEYRHLPELGVPSAWRAELSEDGDVARLMDRYECEILERQVDDVGHAAMCAAAAPTAFLCMEADARQCHRSRLGRRLAAVTGLEVRELRTAP